MKFDSIHAARRYWISGIVIALTGVILARLIAPHLSEKTAIFVKVAGQLIAIVGLVVIPIGVSRRVSSDNGKNETQ
jgi:hypothetical protein